MMTRMRFSARVSRRSTTSVMVLAVVIFTGLLVGCNLGAPADQPQLLATPTLPIVQPQDFGLTPSPTPNIVVPATVTPTPELLPSEKLGPITVDGTTHRTTEPVTIKVTRGKSVSNVTCSWVLQNNNRTGSLGTATSAALDENTFTDTYTFTPDAAGTFSVNCTGIATTASGQRAVSATGTPFAVEAKG